MANDVTLDLGNEYIGSAYSPVVEVTDTEEGHTISITSADPDAAGHLVTHTIEVPNYSEEEEGREAAEAARQAAEAARQTQEAQRQAAESARTSAESERAAEEQERADAETARAAAETARQTAETARQQAEQARAAAETARESDSATAVANAEAATAAANAAAGRVDTAIADAEDATDAAEDAVASATSAAGSATTAAGDANTAAAAATSAASAANTAASTANTAASTAETAAAAADTAREGIQTDLAAKADKTGTYSTLIAGGTTTDSVTDAMLKQTGGVLDAVANLGHYHHKQENPFGMALLDGTAYVYNGSSSATNIGSKTSYFMDWFDQITATSGTRAVLGKLSPTENYPVLAQSATMDVYVYFETDDNASVSPCVVRLLSDTSWAPSQHVAQKSNVFVSKTGIYKITLTEIYAASSSTKYNYFCIDFDKGIKRAALMKSDMLADVFADDIGVNPMVPQPIPFRGYACLKGSLTGESSELYDSLTYVMDEFTVYDEKETGTAAGFFMLSPRIAYGDEITRLTADGQTIDDLWFVFEVDEPMTVNNAYLSSGTNWGPSLAKAAAPAFELHKGVNVVNPTFTYVNGTAGVYDHIPLSIRTRSGVTPSTLNLRLMVFRGNDLLHVIEDVAREKFDVDLLFWGDSLTAGAGGDGTTYPAVCAALLGATHRNCGVGGESANTIAARQGGSNILIPAGAVNGTYSLDALADVFGYHANPLRQGNGSGSGNKLYVNGQLCTLAIDQSSATAEDATYTISGYTGSATIVPVLGKFAGSDFKGKVVVVFVGQNGAHVGSDTDLSARMAIIDSMLAHVGHDRVVVMGLSSGNDESRTSEDTAMLKHYGNRFFPTRRMLVENGMTIAGLTPTSEDETQMAAGTVPASLRYDGVHLNASGYTALGTMLADRIRALGYL